MKKIRYNLDKTSISIKDGYIEIIFKEKDGNLESFIPSSKLDEIVRLISNAPPDKFYNVTTNRNIQNSAANKSKYDYRSFEYNGQIYKIAGKKKDLDNLCFQYKESGSFCKRENHVDLSDITKNDVETWLREKDKKHTSLNNIIIDKIVSNLDFLLDKFNIGQKS